MRIRHNVVPRLAEIFTAILQQIYDWRADMNPQANLAHKLMIVALSATLYPRNTRWQQSSGAHAAETRGKIRGWRIPSTGGGDE